MKYIFGVNSDLEERVEKKRIEDKNGVSEQGCVMIWSRVASRFYSGYTLTLPVYLSMPVQTATHNKPPPRHPPLLTAPVQFLPSFLTSFLPFSPALPL